jgi:hypothetical protein
MGRRLTSPSSFTSGGRAAMMRRSEAAAERSARITAPACLGASHVSRASPRGVEGELSTPTFGESYPLDRDVPE